MSGNTQGGSKKIGVAVGKTRRRQVSSSVRYWPGCVKQTPVKEYSRQIASSRPQKRSELAVGVDKPCTAPSLEIETDVEVHEVQTRLSSVQYVLVLKPAQLERGAGAVSCCF